VPTEMNTALEVDLFRVIKNGQSKSSQNDDIALLGLDVRQQDSCARAHTHTHTHTHFLHRSSHCWKNRRKAFGGGEGNLPKIGQAPEDFILIVSFLGTKVKFWIELAPVHALWQQHVFNIILVHASVFKVVYSIEILTHVSYEINFYCLFSDALNSSGGTVFLMYLIMNLRKHFTKSSWTILDEISACKELGKSRSVSVSIRRFRPNVSQTFVRSFAVEISLLGLGA
jgi:hypothetical protein